MKLRVRNVLKKNYFRWLMLFSLTINNFHHPKIRLNAIKLSSGEHAGSPLHPYNTWVLVGADLRICP